MAAIHSILLRQGPERWGRPGRPLDLRALVHFVGVDLVEGVALGVVRLAVFGWALHHGEGRNAEGQEREVVGADALAGSASVGDAVSLARLGGQWELIERSLIGLSPQDKLELVERLVHELRAFAPSDIASQAPCVPPMSEEEFKQQLLKSGLMSSLPIPADPASRPAFQPIVIEGEPLSETIMRERR